MEIQPRNAELYMEIQSQNAKLYMESQPRTAFSEFFDQFI